MRGLRPNSRLSALKHLSRVYLSSRNDHVHLGSSSSATSRVLSKSTNINEAALSSLNLSRATILLLHWGSLSDFSLGGHILSVGIFMLKGVGTLLMMMTSVVIERG